MPETLTHDAREIVERATEFASARGSKEVLAGDVLKATLQLPGSLADNEIRALGLDPKTIAAQLPPDGDPAKSPPLNQLLVNAGREAQVLGHYQVDSIHLLLALLYSDSPSTSAALQKAGLSLYDLRSHVQTGSKAAERDYSKPPPDKALRRRPWPSLRGVVSVSPFFLAAVGVTAGSGALLWMDVLPRQVPLWTSAFIIGGWVLPQPAHEPDLADPLPAAWWHRPAWRRRVHQPLGPAHAGLELRGRARRPGRHAFVRAAHLCRVLGRGTRLIDHGRQRELFRGSRCAWILHGAGGDSQHASRAGTRRVRHHPALAPVLHAVRRDEVRHRRRLWRLHRTVVRRAGAYRVLPRGLSAHRSGQHRPDAGVHRPAQHAVLLAGWNGSSSTATT
ncbi:MAG: hypothetical protein E6I53_02700 [Chloroflexi bacterium]|nr:MAG: hypothetical protein E6I53_02700 [Chloroflexota bacterium]